jgi:hypothetical protein
MTMWQAILLFGSLSAAAVPQTVDLEKWNTVERMRGKMQQVEEQKTEPIRKSKVRLYRRKNDSPCCGEASPIAEAVTNKAGLFEFKNPAPGDYWVVVIFAMP